MRNLLLSVALVGLVAGASPGVINVWLQADRTILNPGESTVIHVMAEGTESGLWMLSGDIVVSGTAGLLTSSNWAWDSTFNYAVVPAVPGTPGPNGGMTGFGSMQTAYPPSNAYAKTSYVDVATYTVTVPPSVPQHAQLTFNFVVKTEGYHGFVPKETGGQRTIGTVWGVAIDVCAPVGPPLIASIPNGYAWAMESYTGPTPTLLQGAPPVTWSLVYGPGGMTINASTGVVFLEGTGPGNFSITIRATNSLGHADQSWSVEVECPPAWLQGPGNQAVTPGSTYAAYVWFESRCAAPGTWQVQSNVPGLQIQWSDPYAARVWTDIPLVIGTYTISVSVTGMDPAYCSWYLYVGWPPVIAAIPDNVIPAGLPYTGPVPVLTQGTPPVTWSLGTHPAGMTMDTATGVVSWPNPVASGSPYTIKIYAYNLNYCASASRSWRARGDPTARDCQYPRCNHPFGNFLSWACASTDPRNAGNLVVGGWAGGYGHRSFDRDRVLAESRYV